MQKKFLTYTLIFFLPVIIVFFCLEFATRNMDSSFKKNERRLEKSGDSIEVLVLGSSHMLSGINAEYLTQPTLNLASGNQHHDTDFKILKTMVERLPSLKTVVLEVSYGHLEFPHNGKDFWKNAYYLKYYDINCFERTTYFKDRSLFLSNPPLLSERLYEYYITKEAPVSYSKYGFNENNYFGRFKTLKYNETEIAKTNFRINETPNPENFEQNTRLFFEMLAFSKENDLSVIICTTPMYKSYLPARVPEILRRRDSVLSAIDKKYENVSFLLKEEDTLHFGVRDFWNQSHLSPDGALTFTKMFQQLLDNTD